MTDLSTPSKEAFAEQGFGLSISKSTPETIHDFILARMPAPGQTIADAATHHFASLRAISPLLLLYLPFGRVTMIALFSRNSSRP